MGSRTLPPRRTTVPSHNRGHNNPSTGTYYLNSIYLVAVTRNYRQALKHLYVYLFCNCHQLVRGTDQANSKGVPVFFWGRRQNSGKQKRKKKKASRKNGKCAATSRHHFIFSVLFPHLRDLAIARLDAQLEHRVEVARVGHILGAHREEVGGLVSEVLRVQQPPPRVHPVLVASEGVDLTVVAHHSVGLGTVPAPHTQNKYTQHTYPQTQEVYHKKRGGEKDSEDTKKKAQKKTGREKKKEAATSQTHYQVFYTSIKGQRSCLHDKK